MAAASARSEAVRALWSTRAKANHDTARSGVAISCARSARTLFCSVSACWSCSAIPSNARLRWANSSGPEIPIRAERSPVASRSAVSIARDTGLRTVRTSTVAASQASPMIRTAMMLATRIPGGTPPGPRWDSSPAEVALSAPVIAMPTAIAATAVATVATRSQPRSDASRSSIGFQPVADTTQRRDAQNAAEFAPQADDVHVDGLLAHEARSPDFVEKLASGVGAARARHQRLQQVKLPPGELDPVALDGAAPAPPVERH